MKTSKLFSWLPLLLALGWTVPVTAEDIDLFAGINPGGGNPPTVLLGWHSTANSNANVNHGCTYSDDGGEPLLGETVGGMEQCALVNTMLSLLEPQNSGLLDSIKVGLMVFNEAGFSSFNNGTGLGNGDNSCGYLMVPPTLLDADGVSSFVAMLKTFGKSQLANQSRLGDLIAESWAMLNGLSTSCSGVNYAGLKDVATTCRDAVLIYIGNATKENASVADGTGSPDALLKSQLSTAFSYAPGSERYEFFATPRSVTLLNNSGSSNNKYWGDEWTRFMNLVDVNDSPQSDKNVTTYSIAVYDPSLEGKLAGEINFLADLASEGGGKSFKVTADNHAGLGEVLLQIFNEVQDVNSVFSSATLPVSANTQGTYLNQVYIAMFRPDGAAAPRWMGNVKQYQLGFDVGGNIVLTDATQDPSSDVTSVTNPVTGALAGTATSFWTTNTPSNASGALLADWPEKGFWVNSPDGDAFFEDAPDGDLVEKGGVGQILRVDNLTSSAGRRVYTCNGVGTCPKASELPAFATSNSSLLTQLSSVLGAAETGGRVKLSVGRHDTDEDIVISCAGKNKKRLCTVSHDNSGGTYVDAATDKVILATAGGADLISACTSNAPCTISDVTSNSFSFLSATASEGEFENVIIRDVSIAAVIEQSGHGLKAGDQVELENCTVANSSNTYNSKLVTGNVLGSVKAVSSASSYVLTLPGYVLAESFAGVECGASAVTLTADNLVNWMRGDDIVGNEVKKGPCPPESRDANCRVSVRGSIHGDVLHSRPAVINYKDHGVVTYYGSNDGHFRAVNGNQSKNIAGVQPGGELWSFVAPEFFDKLERQYNNYPVVSYPAVVDSDARPRDYFFDGSTTILQDLRSSGDTAGKSFIYMSARRGGRLLYAMDVSDPTAPRFMWRLSNADIPELGQTWSQPKVAQIKAYDKPVLVFGAGYDPAEDQEPAPLANTMGRGIIMVDALNGKVLWAVLPNCSGVKLASAATDGVDGVCVSNAGLTRAIPADVTLLDRNFDGFIDRLYGADVGGNLWRVDLEAGDASLADFKLSKLASLAGSGNEARKFLFPPDVVPTNNYDAVVAVSGDREHPLYTDKTTPAGLAYNVQNRFYMVMDKNTGKEVPDGSATILEQDLVNQTSLQCKDDQGQVVDCDSAGATELIFDGLSDAFAGYYFNLATGEKGVNAPLAVAGKVFFGTNQPDVPAEGSCTANLGNAGAYQVNLVTGAFKRNLFSGGGLPPSPIAGLVTINGETVPFIIGGAGPSPFDPSTPELDLSSGRKRSYWYFQ